MKKICISAFEGSEVKNLLRTGVVAAMLDRTDVSVVLLTKNEERKEFLLREFPHPRISVEIVPYQRTLGSGFDRFFGYLKFLLLRSGTTILRRRIAFESDGNRIRFWTNSFLNMLFARPSFRRIARSLDFLLVRNREHSMWFDRVQPDLIFLAHLFEEPEIHILREAKRRGVRTVGFVNSWDKVTARAIMRLLPDKVVVFNEIVKQEMVRFNEMRPQDIYVAGIPQYDGYFRHREPYSDRETFFKRIGIDPSHRLIVYAPMGRTFSNIDWDICDLLHEQKDAGRYGDHVSILVRFQPNDFIDEHELSRRPYLHYDYPGVRFSATRGVDWDMNEDELKHLHDTLYYLDILVCWAGSLGVDAAIFNKPVINPDLDMRPHEPRVNSPREHYRFAHYEKALQTGAFRLVASGDELARWIRMYLENPALDTAGRTALLHKEVEFLDGGSSDRIAQYTVDMLV